MFLNQGSEVEDIAAMRLVDAVAVQLTMEGKFDAKIAEYKALKDQLDAKKHIADTIEMAEKIKADAKVQADAVAAKNEAADAREARLAVRERAAEVKCNEADSRAAEASRLADETVVTRQRLEAAAKQAQAAIDAREQSVIQQLAQLARDRDVLEAQKKAFNAKLESLRQ